MRCGCPQCGTYMVQQERGLKSGCMCPACGFSCNACMGTEQAPLSKEELRMRTLFLEALRAGESPQCGPDKPF